MGIKDAVCYNLPLIISIRENSDQFLHLIIVESYAFNIAIRENTEGEQLEIILYFTDTG